MRQIYSAIFFFFIAAITYSVIKASMEKAAVKDFVIKGELEESATILSDRFRSELVKYNVFTLMERSQMEEILKEQGFQKSGACNDESCIIEMGELLGVDAIIFGSIGKLGAIYIINIRKIDIKTGQIIRSISRDCKGGVESILKGLEDIAAELGGQKLKIEKYSQKSVSEKPREYILDLNDTSSFLDKPKMSIGSSDSDILKSTSFHDFSIRHFSSQSPTVTVHSRPQGAKVFIDGKFCGETPLEVCNQNLGIIMLKVESAGHEIFRTAERLNSEKNSVCVKVIFK